MQITNICFANNLTLFARGDEVLIQLMMEEFQHFFDATSLQANSTKCKVYFRDVNAQVQQKILEATKFPEGKLPFKYLGVPLYTRNLIVYQYEPLLDKIFNRIMH